MSLQWETALIGHWVLKCTGFSIVLHRYLKTSSRAVGLTSSLTIRGTKLFSRQRVLSGIVQIARQTEKSIRFTLSPCKESYLRARLSTFYEGPGHS